MTYHQAIGSCIWAVQKPDLCFWMRVEDCGLWSYGYIGRAHVPCTSGCRVWWGSMLVRQYAAISASACRLQEMINKRVKKGAEHNVICNDGLCHRLDLGLLTRSVPGDLTIGIRGVSPIQVKNCIPDQFYEERAWSRLCAYVWKHGYICICTHVKGLFYWSRDHRMHNWMLVVLFSRVQYPL